MTVHYTTSSYSVLMMRVFFFFFLVLYRTHVEVVKRIFNGYFFFFIKSPMSQRFQDMQVSMYNINPMDRMRYTCTASGGIIKGEMICKITIALKELHE